MALRNVLTMLGTAAATAALTLLLFAPRGGGAQAGLAVQPVIAQPLLTSRGCTFALTTDKPKYEAGQAPVIEVKASNPTDKPVSGSVWVTVTSASPTAPMSRMLPMPFTLWSHEYAFTLAPNETKSLTAACAAVPALGNVAITMTDQQNVVLAGTYGVPPQGGPNAQMPNGVPVGGGPNGQGPINVPHPAAQQ